MPRSRREKPWSSGWRAWRRRCWKRNGTTRTRRSSAPRLGTEVLRAAAGFDLDQAGPVFADYIAENHLSDRIRFVAGDFFRHPLPQANVVLMGHT
jgi:hypothetical protein